MAAIAGAVFAAHPMATETVSWLASRYDLLATLLCLLALNLQLASGAAGPARRAWRWAAAAALAGALLAKESAAVAPLLALALDLRAQGVSKPGPRLSTLARSVAGGLARARLLWAVLALYFLARLAVLGGLGGYAGYLGVPAARLAENLLHHSRMVLFVPFDDDAYVTPNVYRDPGLASPVVIAPLAVALLLALRSGGARLGLALALVGLLPVAAINGGGRIVYLALVGYALAVGEAAGLFARALQAGASRLGALGGTRAAARTAVARLLVTALLGALVAAYALSARDRNAAWARAGDLVRSLPSQVLTLYPGLPAGARVYVRGLPDHEREVYVYRNVTRLHFDVDRLERALPDLTDAAWRSPRMAAILPVTSFPDAISPEEACRTFFAQYEPGKVTWQPVPALPGPLCRPVDEPLPAGGALAPPAVFGGRIRLVAFALRPEAVAAGRQVQVDLVWIADAPIERSYKAFVHVAGPEGRPLAQRDAEPFDGRYPMGVWPVGVPVRDRHRIAIPASLPPGEYPVLVGLYVSPDGARLPIDLDGTPAGDALRLATLRVTR